jgi:signal transduction histidine kinase
LAGRLALYGVDHQPPIEPWLALLVATFSLAAYADGRAARVAAAVAGAAVLAADIAAQAGGAEPGDVWPSWIFYGLAAVLGRGTWRRRRLTDALAERTVELELERDETARMAVLEERARVARELHDVIAHSVSVMVVQAAVERRTLAPGQAGTSEVLHQIERTGREALVELRRLLGVLRRSDDLPARAPQPGLGQLDALVAQVREAGLPVAVRVEGDRPNVPAGVDLSAYRIVQEALTNTLKHAGAQRAEVVLRYGERELSLEVLDDGREHANELAAAGGGHGLAGMRERASLYGGELAARPRADAPGWHVHARLPYAT